jgi:hypothetical protein
LVFSLFVLAHLLCCFLIGGIAFVFFHMVFTVNSDSFPKQH